METSIESAGEQQVLTVEQKAGPDNKRSTCYTKTFGFLLKLVESKVIGKGNCSGNSVQWMNLRG